MLRRIALRLGRIDSKLLPIARPIRKFRPIPTRHCYSTQVEIERPQDDFWGANVHAPSSSRSAPVENRVYTAPELIISPSSNDASHDDSFFRDPLQPPPSTITHYNPSNSTSTGPTSSTPTPTLPRFKPLGTTGTGALASYTIPTGSAVEMIQACMEEYRFLSTQMIWHMGTEGLKPELQADHVVEPDGRIRMKRVATWREQRRIWRPPPKERFPDHPFKSVAFLKGTILASLETQGLIHKTKLPRPIETDDEYMEAVKRAEKLNRKHEKNHIRLDWPPPQPVVPRETVLVWGWALGPKPERPEQAYEEQERTDAEDDIEEDLMERDLEPRGPPEYPGHGMYNTRQTFDVEEGDGTTPLGTPIPKLYGDDELRAKKWDRAAQLEEDFHQAKYKEALATAERQFVRRSAYRDARDKEREERQEDLALGLEDGIKKERMRLEAVEHINQYAKTTGEDVSEWYKELERPEWGVAERWQPTHIHKGGVRPRSGVRSNFREGVMELQEADAGGVKVGGGSGANYQQLRIGSSSSNSGGGLGDGSDQTRKLIWDGRDESERGGIERDQNEVPTRGNPLGFGKPTPAEQDWSGSVDPRFSPPSAKGTKHEYKDPRPIWKQNDKQLLPGFRQVRRMESSSQFGSGSRGGFGARGGGNESRGGGSTPGFGMRTQGEVGQGGYRPSFGSDAGGRGGYQGDRPPRERVVGGRDGASTRSFAPRDDQSRGGYAPRSEAYRDRSSSFAVRDAPRQAGFGTREGDTRPRESQFPTSRVDSLAPRTPHDFGSAPRERGFASREGGFASREPQSFASRDGDSSPRDSRFAPREDRHPSGTDRPRDDAFSTARQHRPSDDHREDRFARDRDENRPPRLRDSSAPRDDRREYSSSRDQDENRPPRLRDGSAPRSSIPGNFDSSTRQSDDTDSGAGRRDSISVSEAAANLLGRELSRIVSRTSSPDRSMTGEYGGKGKERPVSEDRYSPGGFGGNRGTDNGRQVRVGNFRRSPPSSGSEQARILAGGGGEPRERAANDRGGYGGGEHRGGKSRVGGFGRPRESGVAVRNEPYM